MSEEFLEKYVDSLYERQNIGAVAEQQGLYTKKDYYELLKSVMDVINTYKDYSLEELREKLYEQSHIEENIRDFIYRKEMAPGIVFTYGTDKYRESVVAKNRQEVTLDSNGNIVPAVEKMTEDTIFDLASVTKMFTSLSILKLVSMGIIDLNDKITKYAPEFKNLEGVSVFDLMSFGVPLKTNGRLDRASSREEAEKILFDIAVDQENNNLRPYNDMGAMVLKYVVEHASGMDFYDFVDKNILRKLEMNDTNVVVPKEKLSRVASTNLDGKYYKDGNFFITTEAPKGVAFDPKAQIMGQSDGVLSGHAGMFSTVDDMAALAKGILNGQVLDDKYIEMMAKNRTGREYFDDNDLKHYVQYLGLLCYSKNPELSSSEVYHALSGRTFASAGWTGTQLTVDPLNQLFFFMASNRSHNRMTFIDPTRKDEVTVDENGKKTIILPDGSKKIDATRYAWDRDSVVVHPAIKLAMQYKMLEDFYGLKKSDVEQNKVIRKI